jgi:quinol monooxygenase YgiN
MFRFLVTIKAKPGSLPTIMEAAKPFTVATRAEPGNVAFDMYANFDGSDELVVVEAFKDRAAHKTHEAAPHFLAFMAVARPFFLEGKSETIVDDEA